MKIATQVFIAHARGRAAKRNPHRPFGPRGRRHRFDNVLLDNAAAAREGTRHLISLGHRRILLLASDTSLRNVRERIEGYREALVEADLSGFENVLVAGHNDAEHARQTLLPVLAGPGRPSALFAVTQTMTIGALQTLWEAGLELPKDISLLALEMEQKRWEKIIRQHQIVWPTA